MTEQESFLETQQHTRSNEVALLGAVMRDGEIYHRAREIVEVSDFSWNAYGWVWESFENLHANRMSIDTITVGDELERMGKLEEFSLDGSNSTVLFTGRAALSKVREDGDPRNFLSYAENVKDYSAKRSLLQFLNKGAEWAMNGRRAAAIIGDMQEAFSKITVYGTQDEFTVPISVAVSEAYDWTDQAAQGKSLGVMTGLIDLDKLLGGLLPENVYILAGRPGKGKTGMLLSIAYNVARKGKRVGIFSLEMSRMQVAQRLICIDAEVDLQRATQGKLLEQEWPKYTHGVEQIAAMPIVINDLSSININQIRQTARKIKANGGLDLMIVDYLQLAQGEEKRYQSRELEVSAISRGLKYLARELQVPVLAAAQLSRAIEQRAEKKPVLSDLRESGSLEQDAYCVMFIHTDDDKPTLPTLLVEKHRNGPTGEIPLLFRKQFTKFESSTNKFFSSRSGESNG